MPTSPAPGEPQNDWKRTRLMDESDTAPNSAKVRAVQPNRPPCLPLSARALGACAADCCMPSSQARKLENEANKVSLERQDLLIDAHHASKFGGLYGDELAMRYEKTTELREQADCLYRAADKVRQNKKEAEAEAVITAVALAVHNENAPDPVDDRKDSMGGTTEPEFDSSSPVYFHGWDKPPPRSESSVDDLELYDDDDSPSKTPWSTPRPTSPSTGTSRHLRRTVSRKRD